MSEAQSFLDDLKFEPKHLAGVIVGALLIGMYAAWMAADLVSRFLLFPVIAILAGYFIYNRETRHEQVVFIGYVFAGLLAVTPLLMIIPDALSASTYGRGATEMIFMFANYMLFLFFAILAAIIAYVTFRYDGGKGIIQRIRERGSEESAADKSSAGD